MDILCLNCGEPWDIDYVLHEEPEAFKRAGVAITQCPACKKKKPKLDRITKYRVEVAGAMAEVYGDDIDGYAADLEDFELI